MLKKEKSLTIILSFIILAALLYVIFFLNKFTIPTSSSNINPKNGVLNLTTWDSDKDGYTDLSGQWKFYWNQLLTPKDFSTTSYAPTYMDMPIALNKHNKNYDANGYATYRLIINLNSKYKNTLLGLSVPSMLSSYKLWVNGKLLSSNGIVGTSILSSPKSMPTTSYFMNNNKVINLVLQVSNYNLKAGGTKSQIYLGTQNQIMNNRDASIALDFLYFGILLIVGLYSLWLYIFTTEEISKLYFSCLCMTMSLRSLVIGNKYFLSLYANINYTLESKLQFLTFYLAVYFIISFMFVTFKESSSKIINKICKSFCLFFIAATILSSLLFASKLFLIFKLSSMLFIVYATYIIFKAYRNQNQKFIIIIVAFFSTIIISVMSMLYSMGINNINDYSLLVFFIFILINSFILAMNQSKAYKKIENLSKQKEQYCLNEKLRKATFLLNSTLNLDEVLEKLLKSLKQIIPYDSASFFMEENNQFSIRAGYGFKNMDVLCKIRVNKDKDLLFKEIYETYTTLLVTNVKEDNRFNHYINLTNIESWLGVPIIFNNKIIGILTLDSNKKNIYTKDHCDTALSFAFNAGVAVENAKLHSKTKQLACIDPLTSLYNRRSFFELANKSFDKAKLSVQPISSIMIDIDDFKKINDSLGHHTGDLVLKRLSKICSQNLGENNILGRFGGEEFIVLLPGTSFKQAEIVGEHLRLAIENNPLIIRKSDLIPITSSLGVASITPTTEDLEYLFTSADKAMYQAKAMGKNKVMSINLDLRIQKKHEEIRNTLQSSPKLEI
ncbi:diguanylate cyclase [Clostridium frigoris]|uniref:Diguanylate cyclase n=1 Tax=Clostridium frigoris TaxID=205327 RepID=A0ABS6BSI0_9CLOT|nr:diguanylate cyclase [Clostridium frigoris]MBU3159450.1 diguanylate cyclase [Clostridium frigoris]